MDFFFNFSNSKKVYRMLQKGFFLTTRKQGKDGKRTWPLTSQFT